MAIDKILTPEIEAKVGNQGQPKEAVDEVTRSEIRRWVIATMDDSPVWADREFAESTRFGVDRAPGPYPRRATGPWRRRLGSPDPVRLMGPDDDLRHGHVDDTLVDASLKIHWPAGVGAFHAGDDVEYFQFAKVGDVVSVVEKIVKIEEKTGRSGQLVIVHIDQTYTNQDGEVLMINHGTSIAREMVGTRWK